MQCCRLVLYQPRSEGLSPQRETLGTSLVLYMFGLKGKSLTSVSPVVWKSSVLPEERRSKRRDSLQRGRPRNCRAVWRVSSLVSSNVKVWVNKLTLDFPCSWFEGPTNHLRGPTLSYALTSYEGPPCLGCGAMQMQRESFQIFLG